MQANRGSRTSCPEYWYYTKPSVLPQSYSYSCVSTFEQYILSVDPFCFPACHTAPGEFRSQLSWPLLFHSLLMLVSNLPSLHYLCFLQTTFSFLWLLWLDLKIHLYQMTPPLCSHLTQCGYSRLIYIFWSSLRGWRGKKRRKMYNFDCNFFSIWYKLAMVSVRSRIQTSSKGLAHPSIIGENTRAQWQCKTFTFFRENYINNEQEKQHRYMALRIPKGLTATLEIVFRNFCCVFHVMVIWCNLNISGERPTNSNRSGFDKNFWKPFFFWCDENNLFTQTLHQASAKAVHP